MCFSFVASAQFPDIPSDHWAYEAITKLVDEGLISGMPDGNYHGSEPMNRYSVAVLVAKVLDRIVQQPATVVEKIVQQPVTINQPVQPVIEKTIIERTVQEPVEVTKIVEKEYIEKPVEKIIEKHIVHEFAGLTADEVKAIINEYNQNNAEKLVALEKKIQETDITLDEEVTFLSKKVESNKKLSENLFRLLEMYDEENDKELKATKQELSNEIFSLDVKLDEDVTYLSKRIESNTKVSENLFRIFEVYTIETDKDLEEVNAKVNTLLENLKTAESKAITYTDSKIEESNAKIATVQEDLEKKYATSNRVNEMQTKLDEQNDKLIKMEKDLKTTRTIAILGLLAGIAGIIVGFVIP